MQINRLIGEGKIKSPPIPLRMISDKYFGPPSGLVILVPDGFPPETRPQITGPAGDKVKLRFSLSRQWVERHGVFSHGKSYFRNLAIFWHRLGPKPMIVRAESFSERTLILSKSDRKALNAHYQNNVALKGGLLLWGQDLNQESISREDVLFLNQIEKDPSILKNFSTTSDDGESPPWDY